MNAHVCCFVRRCRIVAIATFVCLCAPLLIAQPSLAQNAPAEDSAAKMMTRTVNAVVGIDTTVPASARSAETLGRQRSGSGVLIDDQGLVLTIGYLLIEAETVRITTDAGLRAPATVVAYDQASGFGLVRSVVPLKLEPARLGKSSTLKADDPVLTVSGGDEGSVTAAMVVSKRPFAGYWEYLLDEAIFTAPPRADHSGAALVNAAGELVGIGSLFVRDARNEGVMPGNMFVPIDLFSAIRSELLTKGTSSASNRPWLGISSQEQDGRIRVVRVSRGGPAAEAGLQAGDLVLEVNGVKVQTLGNLYKELWKSPSSDSEVELTIMKGSTVSKVKVKAVDRTRYMVKPQGV
jgi:S1-C subfamily serine protease